MAVLVSEKLTVPRAPEALRSGELDTELLELPVCVAEGDTVGDGVAAAVRVVDTELDGVRVAQPVAVAVGTTVPLPQLLPLPVGPPVRVGVGDKDVDCDGLPELEAVAVALTLDVGGAVPQLESVGDSEGVPEPVEPRDSVGEGVGVVPPGSDCVTVGVEVPPAASAVAVATKL